VGIHHIAGRLPRVGPMSSRSYPESTICNRNPFVILLTYNGKYYEGICYNLSLDSSNHVQVKSSKNRKISSLKDRVTICAIWDMVEKQQLIRKHLLLRSVDIWCDLWCRRCVEMRWRRGGKRKKERKGKQSAKMCHFTWLHKPGGLKLNRLYQANWYCLLSIKNLVKSPMRKTTTKLENLHTCLLLFRKYRYLGLHFYITTYPWR